MMAVVILLPVLFVLSAFAINLAHIQVVNTKVQIVADAAVRSAGRTYAETGDQAAALVAANQVAAMNQIQGTTVPIEASDLEFGVSQRSGANQAYTFTAGASTGNSVRLTTNAFNAGSGVALQPYFPIGSALEIRPVVTATNAQSTLDIAIVVDRSGSMAFAADEPAGGIPMAAPAGWQFGDPVPPNARWIDLTASVNGFCNELTQTSKIEKVGLVSYASSSSIERDLTENYASINAQNIAISNAFGGGSTSIGDGMLDGIQVVTDTNHNRPWASRAIVLMSDGNHNAGSDPIVAANQAAAEMIPVYTVSFSSSADIVLMQQIADITGGSHYHAVNAQQLNEAFRNIARRLPSLLTQ